MLFVNPLFFVMGSILSIILLLQIHLSSEDQLQKRGLTIANTIATNSLAALSEGNTSLLEPILKGVVQEPAIAYVIVLNNAGKVIAHSNEREIGSVLDDPLTKQALKTSQARIFAYNLNSEKFYDIVVPVVLDANSGILQEATQIGVVRLGISLADLQNGLRKYILSAISVLGILISAGVLISLFFVRLITAPLKQMTAAAVQIAGGDFTQEIKINTQDEVGILASTFIQMSVGLKGVIKKIQENSQQMTSVADQMSVSTQKVNDGAIHQAKAAEKTSASIEQMSASIKNITGSIDSVSASSQAASSSLTEMSASISQVASSTTALSSSVEDTASSLMQMSSSIQEAARSIDTLSVAIEKTASSITKMDFSIQEVGRNAKESAQLSEKVSQDAAELGISAIEKTIEGMEKIKKTVDQSTYVINKLDERTEHIGKILTVIDDVTHQTDLLALNAAILAAQAGNEGKGFAVVAGEIKGLADRTAASTKEIAQLVKDVQSEAKDAVVSIKEGTKSVEEGVRLSLNARESLNQILQSSKRSSEMSRQIEEATLEQVKATIQVTQLMEEVNALVQQINSSMKELQKGTLHITNASEKMKSITIQVKTSTEEQAKGSRQISDAVENVTSRIQQIAQAMNEQKQGNEVITKSIVEIHQIAQVSRQMMQEMNKSVEVLVKQADLLKEEVNRFKV
jgi:methyl-accepting chemotaxis protein